MEKQEEKYLSKIRKLLAKAQDPGCLEAEVEIFMAKAQALMLKYNLEMGDIDIHPSDINKEVAYSTLSTIFKYKYANFEWDLIDKIAKYNNCKIYTANWKEWALDKNFTKVRLTIIGTKENRTIVNEMYETLVHKFLTLSEMRWKEWSVKTKKIFVDELKLAGLDSKGITVKYLEKIGKMDRKRTWCSSYLIGCIDGLSKKLKEERDIELALPADKETWGLICVKHDDLIKARVPELLGKTTTSNGGTKSNFNSTAYSEGVTDGKSNHNNKYLN